jgi:hypothetical protein
MDIDLTQVFTFSAIFGVIGGIAGSIIERVIGNFIDNIFYRKNKNIEYNNNLADRILGICSKGFGEDSKAVLEEINLLMYEVATKNYELFTLLKKYSKVRSRVFKLIKQKTKLALRSSGEYVPVPRNNESGEIEESKLYQEFADLSADLIVLAGRMKK